MVLISINGRWRDRYRFGEFIILIVLLSYEFYKIILFFDKTIIFYNVLSTK